LFSWICRKVERGNFRAYFPSRSLKDRSKGREGKSREGSEEKREARKDLTCLAKSLQCEQKPKQLLKVELTTSSYFFVLLQVEKEPVRRILYACVHHNMPSLASHSAESRDTSKPRVTSSSIAKICWLLYSCLLLQAEGCVSNQHTPSLPPMCWCRRFPIHDNHKRDPVLAGSGPSRALVEG